jgi:hypothetical protein
MYFFVYTILKNIYPQEDDIKQDTRRMSNKDY